ncbi:MAG: hypothetical protein JSS51_06020 [Planctomycetes bacterium]|nr:hypothetical protein [Planctomycetota bacterium]
MMKTLVSAAAVVATSAGVANAAILYQTSFEAPTFNATLNGVDGWITQGGGTVGSTAGAARTGTRYVQSANLNTSGQWQWQGAISQNAASIAAAPIIKASVWLAHVAGTSTALRRGGLQMYDSTGGTIFAALYIQSDGSITATDGTGTAYSTQPGAVVNPSAYNQVEIELNYTTQLATFRVNGATLSLPSGAGTFVGTDFGDADFFSIRGSGTTGGSSVRYDDYVVEQIPAPGAFALLGLGGLIAGRRRRA